MSDAKFQTISLGPTYSSGPTITSLALNNSTRKVAGVFQMPSGASSYTLTRIGFRVGTVTGTSPTYRASLQAVDASGLPDGTVLGGGSPASATFSAAGWANSSRDVTLDNSYSAAPGEVVAAVIDYSSGTVNASNNAQFGYTVTNVIQAALVPHGMDYQTNWTKRNLIGPFAVGTSTELFGNAFASDLNSTTGVFTNATSPDEIGVKFTVPEWYDSFTIFGPRVNFNALTGGGTFELNLYEGGGASDTTPLVTTAFDHDYFLTNLKVPLFFDSSTDISLTAGQTYRISIKATSTANINLRQCTTTDAGYWDASPLQQVSMKTTRAGGNWSDDATIKMPWDLVLGSVTTSGGGGGSGRFYVRGAV